MQAPGEEEGLSDGMIMRQAATMEGGHEEKVVGEREVSQQGHQADWQSAADYQSAPQTISAQFPFCRTSRAGGSAAFIRSTS